MTANKLSTRPGSDEGRFGRTDFAKVDAHVIQPHEYDEIPELTDEWFAQADLHVGGKLIRRGRPPLRSPKKQVTVRLDADVLDGLRATGAGWQTRVNTALREWLARQG